MKRLLLLISVSIIVFSGCADIPDRDSVTMPQYDTEYNFPLANRHYQLSDQIDFENDEYLSSDELNQYIYKIEYDTLAEEQDIVDFIDARLDTTYNNIDISTLNSTGVLMIGFSEGIALNQAVITEGKIKLVVENRGTVKVSFDITMPAFRKFLNVDTWLPGGQTEAELGAAINIKSTLEAGQDTVITHDLNDYFYDASDQEDKTKFKITGKIASESQNDVTADIIIENSAFRYISGTLPSVKLDQIVTEFELPISNDVRDFREHMVLRDPTMLISANYLSEVLINSGGTINEIFDVLIEDMFIVGRTSAGETIDLTDKAGETNLGGLLITDGNMVKEFNNSNSNISEFLTFLPDEISITAFALMNPENGEGSATDKDKIQISFSLDINGILSISNLTVNDIMEVEFTSDDRGIIRDAREAILTFELWNGLPLEGDITMGFRGESDGNYDTLFFSKNLTFDGAEQDDDFFARAPRHTKKEIHLDSLELRQLSIAKRIQLDMIFSTTDGKQVAVRSTDSVHILGYGWVRHHLNINE
ncbi:MAG: hypothetical protein PF588_00865 [Candidatus Kapabacteria bacterium]|jgi:hypothetical protein|nr:hypothetical protein [Candidatus Kapabacteria bacterium]